MPFFFFIFSILLVNPSPTYAKNESEVCRIWSDMISPSHTQFKTWTGDLGSCVAGTIGAEDRQNTLRQVNGMRALADLDPVSEDVQMSPGTQECALMLHANNNLSHNPPPSWKCYSTRGAATCGKSNIAWGAHSIASVRLYFSEGNANATTMGHRRWLLKPSLSKVGIGSTTAFSAIQIFGGPPDKPKDYMVVAWPAPGPQPLTLIEEASSTGWTLQSDTLDLDKGTISIYENDQPRQARITTLAPYYGSASAVLIAPLNISAKVGNTYKVVFSSSEKKFHYSFTAVGCE